MKMFFVAITFLASINLFGQEDKFKGLVTKGVELHDQGKYEQAITQYKAALDIDQNSALANYEISYSYFLLKQYDNAIRHSKIVVDKEADLLQEALMILGSAYDMTGKPDEAIRTYEKGLKKFPGSTLLNYNLALTCHNQRDFKKAEAAAIAAIIAKPTHASSHIVLASIMQQTGQRVKSLLALHYSLMLEPKSNRSVANYQTLQKQLGQGVEQKDDKSVNITIPAAGKEEDDFGPAEMMIGLLSASRYTEKNEKKSALELFAETNESFFSVLGELSDKKKGFWWSFYVPKFYDLVKSKNVEAYSYYISQSSLPAEASKWAQGNKDKLEKLIAWIEKLYQ